MNKEHEQLRVAVGDLCIELGINPRLIEGMANRPCIGAKVSVKTAQKLLDAGLLSISN